ncbi:Nuclear transport factor 2 (NTF2) family protein with RNA binding (RRM-RBD-RNP motifs) domain [Euphorbia peplus]|nr:Nuclear transport factor 2 (NTF2) family protein with RNA binding (RRM-RBD-RNP motifs) domain [Euphorbia peplus]
MSTPYPIPVTAAQVGTYFVGQYYQLLQHQPELVYQFYNDASSMLRIDGTSRHNATSMLHIHALAMSLNFSGIEIKTAHSLESWNGGVLEKGFFVLNDVFHFIDEEPIHHHPSVLLAQNNLDSKMNTPMAISEQVPNYLLGGEIQAREFVSHVESKENGAVDNYNFPEQQLQLVHEPVLVRKEIAVESNGYYCRSTVNNGQAQLPVSPEEPTGEPQKHTYASILRVTKGNAPSAVRKPSFDKTVSPPASDWNDTSQPLAQQSTAPSNSFDKFGADMADEISALEDEDEILSVYVRNLPTTVSETEIEEEFKNFGKIPPDGVVIRSRKDVGVCYAFVEFEDMTGVRNAVKAGSAHVAGRQVYIEERRPNSNIPSRVGRGRGRGRSSYPADAPRGRYGVRSYARGSNHEGGDSGYSKSRGNGYYRSTYQVSRGVENESD